MTPGYRTCRKAGCGFGVKQGKRVCLRCGTPVASRPSGSAVPAPDPREELRQVKLARFWR
jgi:hypothetical protein